MVQEGSRAKSGRDNENYLLLGAESQVNGMSFLASHPARNKAPATGVAFLNRPVMSGLPYVSAVLSDVPESHWALAGPRSGA